MKIVSRNDNKHCKLVYNILLTDADLLPNKISWATLVRNLLSTLGFHDVWLAQSVGNVNVFLNVFKQRLNDTFIQNWHERLNSSNRALFFRSIISTFEYQFYLYCIDEIKYKTALTRLISSSHNLKIETGRWHKPRKIPLENRLCVSCNKIEDEYHFILECINYTALRKIYIKKYYWSSPSMFKLTQLFENKNKTIIKNLSIFIFKAFQIHDAID